jgi:hypothetical protein
MVLTVWLYKGIHGENFLRSKPEGRGRQDHHQRQPVRRAGQAEPARAAGRPRPPGQRHHGRGHQQGRAGVLDLPGAAGRGRCRQRAPAQRSRALRRAAGEPRAGRRRSRDGGTGQPRTPPEGSPGQGRRRLRFHPDRLPAGAVDADPERPGVRARRDHPDAVRVLRIGRPVGPGQHDQEGARQPEPRPAHHRPAARDVRSAHDPLAAGLGPARAALRRQGLQNHHPAQRAPGRSALVWHPGVVFDPSSKGAQAYIAFGAEMVERIKTM